MSKMYNNLHYMTCSEFTDLTNSKDLINSVQSEINDIINIYPGTTIEEVKEYLIQKVFISLPSDKVILKNHYYKLIYLEKKLKELNLLNTNNNQFISFIPNYTPNYPIYVSGTYDCDEGNTITKNLINNANKDNNTLLLNDTNNLFINDNLYIGEEQHTIQTIKENQITLTNPIKNNYSANTEVRINNFVLTSNNNGPICRNLKTNKESPVNVICPKNLKQIGLRCYKA